MKTFCDLRPWWIALLGTLTVTIHSLVIEEWTHKTNQRIPILVSTAILFFLLLFAFARSFCERTRVDAFVWGLLMITAGAVFLAKGEYIDPVLLSTIWAFVVGIGGAVAFYNISRQESLDRRTFLYGVSVLISMGSGVLCSVAHDIQLASIGFLVALWSITIIYAISTIKNTVSKTEAVIALIIATGLTIGISVALFEQHAYPLLILSLIYQIVAWVAWVLVTVYS